MSSSKTPSNYKIKLEINSLIHLGMDTNLAEMIIYKKYGLNELAELAEQSFKEEQQQIIDELNDIFAKLNETENDDKNPAEHQKISTDNINNVVE